MHYLLQRKKITALCAAGIATFGLTSSLLADEVTVKNDSLVNGSSVAICPCFTAGEEAAVWLTSPFDGNIVAIQVFWRSLGGGAPQSLEDAIVVYNGGAFPNPGSIKDQLDGPVLTDGVLNEYRFKDENMTIPISIPVTAGEEFVVSFRFANQNNTNPTLPSIVADTDGCQNGKNTIKVDGTTWFSACALGVGGDWVIRAVVDSTGAPTGAACLQDGTCQDGMTEAETVDLGGMWNGAGTSCADVSCLGACYIPATDQCVQFDFATCDLVGGTWNGPGSVDCPPACPADLSGDGNLNFFDVSAFLSAFGKMQPEADFTDDGVFNFFDVSAFLAAFNAGCP